MEYRPLNIMVISADDIKDVKLFSKMDVYVEAWIAGYPQSKKKTIVDKDAGTRPKWNQRIDFIVDEPYLTKPGLSILFNLKAHSSLGKDKDIGSVTVPVHDLYTSRQEAGDRLVEFPVITTSGKPKGTLKISYHFGDKFTQQVEAAKRHADGPVTAYPTAQPYYAAPQYPPQAGYGGYPPPPQGPGYGYAPPPAAAYLQKPQKNKMGMGGGLGLGLGAGLLGGLLVGEMASDVGEAAAYADGYGDAMGDMGGGFDF